MGAQVTLNGRTFDITTAEKAGVKSLPFGAEIRRKKKKDAIYINDFGCFDIETTSVCTKLDDKGKFDEGYGYMYIWQFYSEATGLVMGHYWSEFILLLQRIHEHYQASNPVFLIFVHNLPFEAAFFLDQFHAAGYDGKIFATAPRKPVCITYPDLSVEFRCSLKLTNRGLGKYLADMHTGYEKLTGELDYRKLRTPKSRLNPDTELAYCAADVIGLYYALKADMKQTGDTLASLPLTSTGYVRRELKAAVAGDKNYVYLLKHSALTPKQYRIVKQLAKGGDTLGSASQLLGFIHHNVSSFDFVSSYPAQLLCERMPCGGLDYEGSGKRITLDYLHGIQRSGRYYIMQCVVRGLELKEHMCPIPCITESKNYYTKNPLMYNGRLLRADEAGLAFDMISFNLFEEQYKYDEILFGEVYSCRYEYLPEKVRDFIYNYFKGKCLLGDKKKELKKHSPEWEKVQMDYNLYKNRLNGIYGMFYTDPLQPDNVYNFKNCTWRAEIPKVILKEQLDDLNPYVESFYPEWLEQIDDNATADEVERILKEKGQALKDEILHENQVRLYRNQCMAAGPYLWGIHTASMARYKLNRLIKAAGNYNVIYSDTDSIKVKSVPEALAGVARLNEELKDLAISHGAYFDTGKKVYYLGIAENETPVPYLEFVTHGAKKYAYRDEDGLHTVISGVSKEQVVQLKDNIENFKHGFVFRPAGGIMLRYIEEPIREVKVYGDDGTEDTILLGNNIYCEERTITIGGVTDERFGDDFAAYEELFSYMGNDDNY